ncbi:MAG TPA: hypothetical protein PLP17_04360 [Oligoflexia bacterium]|nr:hypothetical protein [Oligoflexia bacterium]
MKFVVKKMFWFFVICVVACLLCAGRASAQAAGECSAAFDEIAGQETVATAGSFDNLRKAKGSLRFETQRLLSWAWEKEKSLYAPADLCRDECTVAERPLVVFRAEPRMFLNKNKDAEFCAKMMEQTKKTPFVYTGRTFASLDEFSSWFMDFSTGSGVEGKDLYRRCARSCSPQYTIYLSKQDKKLEATAEVLCGPARDKDDNQYNLSVGHRWSCLGRAAR